MKIIGIILILINIALPSLSNGLTISKYAKEYIEGTNHGSKMYFLGYIKGTFDMWSMMISAVHPDEFKRCIPSNVQYGQLATIGANYIQEHPEEWHLSGSALLGASWIKAFKCNFSSQED